MRFQKNISAVFCVILLGLFPAFSLVTQKLMLLVLIVSVSWSRRHVGRSAFQDVLSYRTFAFAQFSVFFFLNAMIFDVLEGGRAYYRDVALANWGATLFCLAIFAVWLERNSASDVRQALIRWLPLGLTTSFLTATFVYVVGDQGSRIEVFATSALGPPLWFLVLTMCSFAWFSQMSRAHQIWRLALLFMAGGMVVYGGARLVMLAWLLSGGILALWLCLNAAPERRLWVILGSLLCVVFGLGGIVAADTLVGGRLVDRMAVFSEVDFTYESISAKFLRLKIWAGATSLVSDHLMFGMGQVNERFAMNQELEWKKWMYAHQTYLSYLIAGGIPALISGLIMQSPVLAFLKSAKRSTMLPAFLGLGVVVTMNCFTDSIFQSAVNVQVFMAATLIFLRASDADQPILAPQKHVSSAII